MTNPVRVSLSALFCFLFAPLAFAYSADSWLTFVRGTVQIHDRQNPAIQPATVGMPITSSSLLSTGNDGLAEISFPDGTTIRLTGDTSLQFDGLWHKSASITRNRQTTIELLRGTIYISHSSDSHQIYIGARWIRWFIGSEAVNCRISREGNETLLAVLSGKLSTDFSLWPDVKDHIWLVDYYGSSDSRLRIAAGKSVRVDAGTGLLTYVAYGIDRLSTDEWNDSRQNYSQNSNDAS